MKEEEPSEPNLSDILAYRIAYLVAGFMRGSLTEAENTELDDWTTASMDNQRLFEKLTNERNIEEWLKQKQQFHTEDALAKIKTKISFAPVKKKAGIKSLWPYAAAACLLIGLLLTFLLIPTKNPQQPKMVQTQAADLPPGKDRATLTLSDGRKLVLDSIQNGVLAAQGTTNITKLDSGQLAYQLVRPAGLPQVDMYNTMTVPAGGQYKLVLPDGTRVWLNSSSSLKYPAVFGGAKRRVELTGEGYFEVAKDPMYPFEVNANGSTVQVLGTHFCINAYADEPVLKVTLAEGSIKLNNSMLLQRGEEAVVTKNRNILKSKADLETALAWTKGQFVFKGTPLDVLMRQVGRWYNTGIEYETVSTEHFNASIPRDVPVSKLLHILEATGRVHFTITSNKITVLK
jgi:transmembrane sensor